MINAIINTNVKPYRVDIVGHASAERNEDGRDLVCCCVSAFTCALAHSIMQSDVGDISGGLDVGDTHLVIFPATSKSIACRRRVEYFAQELQMMEESHPNEIHVEWTKHRRAAIE